jgi:nucleoside-diphosphate-sugar epimerase
MVGGQGTAALPPERNGSGKSVLITGGGGFLGKAVARRLSEKGERVCSFSRRFHPQLQAIGIEQIQGDLSDAGSVLRACTGKQVVFHTAARAGVWGGFEDFYRTNVLGTRNVIAACKAAGVRILVYTSSPSVIFDGTDMEGVDESAPYPRRFHAAYPRTKAMAEKEVVAAAGEDLRTIILRPHLIWGPEDPHFAPRIIARSKRLRRVGTGNNRVDTIYVDNAADAHLLAADRLASRPELSGRIYFISQDDPIPLWDMVNAILAAAGLSPVSGSVSPTTAWLAGAVLELAYKTLRLKGEPPMTRFLAKELATAHWFNIQAARKDLGYRPRVSTAEGLRRLAAWLQEET